METIFRLEALLAHSPWRITLTFAHVCRQGTASSLLCTSPSSPSAAFLCPPFTISPLILCSFQEFGRTGMHAVVLAFGDHGTLDIASQC
ncbi:hypothetical protein OIU85_014971 [Salix viminalis]|uniref:Uncharacterized protein n=1 Tax=Salix viminalis TaxID=40686 RepID=A0A9Q0NJU1_SALVM|nr:hypothetical protein OIU85_014971 [Salix viminalis]